MEGTQFKGLWSLRTVPEPGSRGLLKFHISGVSLLLLSPDAANVGIPLPSAWAWETRI